MEKDQTINLDTDILIRDLRALNKSVRILISLINQLEMRRVYLTLDEEDKFQEACDLLDDVVLVV